MDNKNLKRLMSFVQVVNTGSFTAAAKKLDLPRSSVSQQISALEKSIDMRLLQRTTRKLSLTSEGERVYKHSQDIQGLLTRIDLLTSTGDTSGMVTISVNTDIAQLWLIPRIAEFRQHFPDIYVRVVGNDYVSDMVEEKIDLAIRIAPTGKDYSQIGRMLAVEKCQFYAAKPYIEKCGEPHSIEELQAHDCILLKQQSPHGEVVLIAGAEKRTFKPVNNHVTDSPYILNAMLNQGFGVGILIPSVARQGTGENQLSLLLPQYHSTVMQITLVYPSRQLPLRTRLLADYLVESGWLKH